MERSNERHILSGPSYDCKTTLWSGSSGFQRSVPFKQNNLHEEDKVVSMVRWQARESLYRHGDAALQEVRGLQANSSSRLLSVYRLSKNLENLLRVSRKSTLQP